MTKARKLIEEMKECVLANIEAGGEGNKEVAKIIKGQLIGMMRMAIVLRAFKRDEMEYVLAQIAHAEKNW